jgi:hypothetical protein
MSYAELCENRNNWRHCKELISNELHTLIVKGGNLSTDRSDTELLSIVRQYNTKQCGIIAGFMLAVQADDLPGQAIREFIAQVKLLLSNLDKDHLVYIQKEVVIICHKTTEMLCNIHQSSLIIHDLIDACSLLAPSPTCLTAVHADVLQVITIHIFAA